MRRPLFTTGLPQVPPAIASITATPNSALSVLDLRSLSTQLQSYTRFVTLYAANQAVTAEVLSIAWREGDGTPILLSSITLPVNTLPNGPTKVLDRFPLRGDVELIVSNAVGDAAVVWGYFEFDGVSDVGLLNNSRPLTPAALETPYSYAPVFLSTDDSAQVHLFDASYYDLITLDVATLAIEGSIEKLVITDGTDSVDVVLTSNSGAPTYQPTRLFDGIPMGAAADASGTPGIMLETSADSVAACAQGFFQRVT